MLENFAEKVFQPVIDAVSAMHYSFQLALILAVIIITQGPKLLALRSRWIDYRLNRNKLEFEKERLETLKLHYEIEAIKKQHSLPTDEYENELFRDREGQKTAFKFKYPEFPNFFTKVEARINRKPLWQWVARNPGAGKIVLNILYYLIAFYAYIFAFGTISLIAVAIFDKTFVAQLGIDGALGMVLMYFVFTALSFYWKKVYAHWLALVVDIKQE